MCANYSRFAAMNARKSRLATTDSRLCMLMSCKLIVCHAYWFKCRAGYRLHCSQFDHDRFGSSQVPGTEVVPSNWKQLGSVRVYTTSEIEPVRIGFELRASVNRLLVSVYAFEYSQLNTCLNCSHTFVHPFYSIQYGFVSALAHVLESVSTC